MLLGKNFDEIDSDTIKSLIDGGASESVHLEFKRETYGNADADKKEFLKDITAFANTLGGHLIIGIDENDGVATSAKPISGNIDDELQRLENMARTGIEPTITGLRIKRIDNENIIVIHVPRSFNPPHRVIYKGINRYYGRKSAIVHQLSLEELRQAFGEQRSIEERAKSFIGQRFLSIQANDGIMPLAAENGALVMHLVPLPNFGAERRIDIVKIEELHEKYFNTITSSPPSYFGINLDGYYAYCPYQSNPCKEYTQVFRNGVIEAINAGRLFGHDENFGHFLAGKGLCERLITALNIYMEGLRILEITPPILLQISMMGVKGIRMTMKQHACSPYERDVLHLPPSVIPEFSKYKDYRSVIAEQMHFLWNAFGVARCDFFNENNELDFQSR